MAEEANSGRFVLSAAVVLWRGGEVLVMKRTGGFSPGGWFLPAGRLEPGERPIDAAARELYEETSIEVEPASLRLVDVMTYDREGTTAHGIVYNGECDAGTECVLNEEHHVAKWMTPDAYIGRFLDAERLRGLGVPESAVELAAEVARVVRSAERARQG
jgi:8-oxo-dGTP diphosphatase